VISGLCRELFALGWLFVPKLLNCEMAKLLSCHIAKPPCGSPCALKRGPWAFSLSLNCHERNCYIAKRLRRFRLEPYLYALLISKKCDRLSRAKQLFGRTQRRAASNRKEKCYNNLDLDQHLSERCHESRADLTPLYGILPRFDNLCHLVLCKILLATHRCSMTPIVKNRYWTPPYAHGRKK
jgi:hypothetical protein